MSRGTSGALLALSLAAAANAAEAPAGPTFSKDVAPILNARCVACHRAGEIGPMPLTSYKEARPYARSIRDVVADGKMPPWHADPHFGRFSNDRRLSEAEVATVLKWVASGAPEGDPKQLPPSPQFATGWQVGKPDLEIAIPKPFDVPAQGEVEYQYMTVPTGFTEDKWIKAAEIRPGNREVVHHVIVFVLPPEGEPVAESMRDRERYGSLCPEARPDVETLRRIAAQRRSGRVGLGTHLVGWAPGLQGVVTPPGSAMLIRAGSRLQFQLHYTPNGKPAVDRETRVGFIFAKEPVKDVMHTIGISNMRIVIPPGEPNYEAKSCYVLGREVTLLSFMPHMHYRGKDFLYEITFPDGKKVTPLSVPRYDFAWQTYYELAEPMKLPKGTRIDCTAHFDNSARNKYNPDPSKEVRWGDQTWEEMLIGWITFNTEGTPPATPATSATTTGAQ